MSESKTTKTPAAKIMAQMRYNAKNFEQINFPVKKDMKDYYKQQAKLRGIGFHEMIRRGLDEYIQNHPPKEEG